MSRTRYLPPGSMRRQRQLGRLEGSVATLVLVALLGLGLIAATPAELYRPAPATHHPSPKGAPAHIHAVQMPLCGAGKDCSDLDVVRPVPEPGTIALIGAGLMGLIWRSRT
ncbi:MAG TPA: PEP-CTERM sorting domain-containing protein [Thiomonas arsenitoxydans]|uniref:PEP-CTERM sorting domain-containing protein n=1 Tax=Thiomonas arsenitoxydans (strain DSM 22701 / CIP 110005 / 3As) TaxID=426114 RepID=UPI002C0E9618|nr:PEP-CTERM sorting domain-containing protein [Thiomonas arsenitoxydans]HML83324.1 PEP-CTERM sorting domain-containing protein [Thiomonas arsenitoxydans]